jgi:6,7-dimethyl-8-ribityllumazine synthase
MSVSRGEPVGEGRRVAVVVSRFHEHVTAKLLEGALSGLRSHGVADEAVDVAWVPGAFEISLVAKRMASTAAYDAVICLGAVVRGETAHFDLVAAEAARGTAEVGRETGVPVIFEVLATESLADAEARAGGPHGNKGWDAAEAALEMADLLDRLPQGSKGNTRRRARERAEEKAEERAEERERSLR